MSDSVESLVAYCRENKRVCPSPAQWDRFWKTLPNRERAGNEPPPPLILAAWHETPAILKMLRLAEQIEWGATQGALEAVARFLRELREEDWYHLGE